MIKRLPWLRRLKRTDPEPPVRLPIASAALSAANRADSRRLRAIRTMVFDKAEVVARKHGVDRREFLASSCGMAATLLATNLVNGCANARQAPSAAPSSRTKVLEPVAGSPVPAPDPPGPACQGYALCDEACEDPDVADALLCGDDQLVIDMHTHMAFPPGESGRMAIGYFLGRYHADRYPWVVRSPDVEGPDRLGLTEYVNQVLLGSPTSVAMVSGTGYSLGTDGTGAGSFYLLTNEDRFGAVERLNETFSGRVLRQCAVMPNDRLELQLMMMERNAPSFHAWMTDTAYTTQLGGGYWLDSDVASAMFQRGIDLGRPLFCIRKGSPQVGASIQYSSARDVGPAARNFPEATLVIYHSAFEAGFELDDSSLPPGDWRGSECGRDQLSGGLWPEGPYDEADPSVQAQYPLDRGVNSLIHSLRQHNIGPNGRDLDDPSGPPRTRVYAECSTAWAALMTGRNTEAMHYWGKLLKHVGEDRILWGTNCLWFGSPTPLIQAFQCFEISSEFQERYGYPALTAERKAKILGRNAARLLSADQDVDLCGKCNSDVLGSEHAQLQQDLDAEFGRRRDMIV